MGHFGDSFAVLTQTTGVTDRRTNGIAVAYTALRCNASRDTSFVCSWVVKFFGNMATTTVRTVIIGRTHQVSIGLGLLSCNYRPVYMQTYDKKQVDRPKLTYSIYSVCAVWLRPCSSRIFIRIMMMTTTTMMMMMMMMMMIIDLIFVIPRDHNTEG